MKSAFLLAALLSLTAPRAFADPLWQDDLNWLKTMAFAVHQTDYSGTFVYQYGNHVETSRITHVVDRDGEYSRLEGLDGARREIIHHNDEVWCYLGDRKIKLEKRHGGRAFPALLPDQLSLMNENYLVRQTEEGRVAGFHAHAMLIKPRDNLRYHHRMWAHVDSGLLLKAEVMDERGRVIEKYAFTQLTIGGNIDRTWIEAEKSAAGDQEHKQHADAMSKIAVSTNASGWQVDALPAGFKKVTEMRRTLRSKNAPVTHLVFSDGLAGISVFIEAVADNPDASIGLSSQGAMHVYSKVSGDNVVTVVGEVPPRTVIQVAESVRYSGK